jgi:peptidoglycan/LPS O-acetylase OafA/YrhL
MQNYSFNSVEPLHIQKLQFIDNLRALAILLVILHHVGEAFPNASYIRIISPWGKIGVQLFFVMSAFTLCYTGSKLTVKPKIVLGFYIKRFFRIAPMYYLAIVAYYYLAYITSNISGSQSLGNAGTYTNLNVLSNVFFLHGLYPPANNTIVPGGWSIGCEMLFYLLFPFLLNLARSSNAYLLAVQAISLFAVGGLLIVAKLNGHHGLGGGSSFAYYFIANQMPVFLLGILLFFFWRNDKFYKILLFSSVIGVISIITFNYIGLSSWVWIIIPPVTGVFSCLLAKIISKVHLHKIFSRIGQVSYSMYISHFVFVWLVAELFKRARFNLGDNISVALIFMLVVILAYFFSKITYNLIEVPFIRIGKNLANVIYSINNKQQLKEMEISRSK